MIKMAGLEEKMLGWPEFRNPRERFAYPTPDQIRTMEFVEGRDGPAGLRGLETIGPFIPSDDMGVQPLVAGTYTGKGSFGLNEDGSVGRPDGSSWGDSVGDEDDLLKILDGLGDIQANTGGSAYDKLDKEYQDKINRPGSSIDDVEADKIREMIRNNLDKFKADGGTDTEILLRSLGKSPELASKIVGYEDWTVDGPPEQGPIPAVKDWNINHKGLKRFQDEIREMRLRGLV